MAPSSVSSTRGSWIEVLAGCLSAAGCWLLGVLLLLAAACCLLLAAPVDLDVPRQSSGPCWYSAPFAHTR